MAQPTSQELNNLVQNCCLSADSVIMDTRATGVPEVQVTRAGIKRALEFALGNDLIEFKSDGTGKWMALEPPFKVEDDQ